EVVSEQVVRGGDRGKPGGAVADISVNLAREIVVLRFDIGIRRALPQAKRGICSRDDLLPRCVRFEPQNPRGGCVQVGRRRLAVVDTFSGNIASAVARAGGGPDAGGTGGHALPDSSGAGGKLRGLAPGARCVVPRAQGTSVLRIDRVHGTSLLQGL